MSAWKISRKAEEVLLIHSWSASLCSNNGRPSLRALSATLLCDLHGHPDRTGALTGAEGHKGDDVLPGKAATFTQALCMTHCFDFLFGAVFLLLFLSKREKIKSFTHHVHYTHRQKHTHTPFFSCFKPSSCLRYLLHTYYKCYSVW